MDMQQMRVLLSTENWNTSNGKSYKYPLSRHEIQNQPRF